MFLCLLVLALLFFQPCRLQALFHLNGVGFNIPAQLGGMAQLFELLCEEADLLGTGFVAVELLALLYQHSDFIFRFLPDGTKLPPVLYVVFENEFRLLDPLVQPADILPHSIAWVSGQKPGTGRPVRSRCP